MTVKSDTKVSRNHQANIAQVKQTWRHVRSAVETLEKIKTSDPGIQFENVQYIYGELQEALNHIEMDLFPGCLHKVMPSEWTLGPDECRLI